MDILILVRYAVIKHEKTLNIEAYRLRHRNWRKKNIDELNIYFWNRRGLRYNITGKLLQDKFIEQDKKCYYCNVKLKYPNFQIEHTTPKDNSKVVISCSDCNRLKWTRNEKEFKEFIKDYITRFKNYSG